MTDLKKIEWSPFRGKAEPVKNINIAQLQIHTNYLEIKLSYDFEYRDEDTIKMMFKEIRGHNLIPKQGISLERTVVTHNPEDKCHVLIIDSPSINEPFWVWTTEDKIVEIFKELKSWLL